MVFGGVLKVSSHFSFFIKVWRGFSYGNNTKRITKQRGLNDMAPQARRNENCTLIPVGQERNERIHIPAKHKPVVLSHPSTYTNKQGFKMSYLETENLNIGQVWQNWGMHRNWLPLHAGSFAAVLGETLFPPRAR